MDYFHTVLFDLGSFSNPSLSMLMTHKTFRLLSNEDDKAALSDDIYNCFIVQLYKLNTVQYKIEEKENVTIRENVIDYSFSL